jgi:CopG family transcriptional regulator, nickel-responsive regulator
MANIVRFGVSIEERLLDRFDTLITEKAYVNRSEALRDLIRASLVEEQWEAGDDEVVGTVTLVYDHHTSDLAEKLTDHQHSHHEEIVSTLHVHLDAHHCLEVVVLRGAAAELKRIAEGLIGTKGVKHGKFVATTTGDIA